MGISTQALTKWMTEARPRADAPPLLRPQRSAVPVQARERIRACYLDHFKVWGPQVLADWAANEGLGTFSATTVARVIDDLRDPPPPKPTPVRYEVTASGAVWSEDGAGFHDRGHKRELLVCQDEHSRFKVNHRLVPGPANEDDVVAYLEQAFITYGAPLVLKHDGGSIFHTGRLRHLLETWKVTELTSPPARPQYNGKKERSFRDVRTWERAMRRYRPGSSLRSRVDAAVHDLNEDRPRPVLGGRTARQVFTHDRRPLPDRAVFIQEVNQTHDELLAQACSRNEQAAARRRAVERVLCRYGLLEVRGDVSTDYDTKGATS